MWCEAHSGDLSVMEGAATAAVDVFSTYVRVEGVKRREACDSFFASLLQGAEGGACATLVCGSCTGVACFQAK